MYTFVFHRKKNIDIVERLEKFLSNFNTKEANETFEKWLMITSHIGLFSTIMFGFCTILIFIYPIIFYFIIGEKILHFGFELPWVDWKTLPGYALNFAYCGTLSFLYIIGQIAAVVLSIIYVVVAFGQFELLKVLLDDLNKLAVANKKGKNDEKIQKLIITITQMHNELSQ